MTIDLASPIPTYLLPENISENNFCHLEIGGVDVIDLAEEFGTPLFVYDENHVRTKLRELRECFELSAYASKAFLCKYLARIIAEENVRLDVSTGGELGVALEAGFDPSKIIFHGNNRSTLEFVSALKANVGIIVLDCFEDLERLSELSKANLHQRGKVQLMVRVTPGVEAHTHEYVKTGQEDTKFGFSLASGDARRAIEAALKLEGFEFRGIHFHIGSQIYNLEPYSLAVEAISQLANTYEICELSVGGGLGVPYVTGEPNISFRQWSEELKKAVAKCGLSPAIKLAAEPGRAVIANSCITLYRVGNKKVIQGKRIYVAVDGGMSDNPRPSLYGSGYEAFLPRELYAPRPLVVRVVGKHCETGDILISAAHVPEDLAVGDILATPVTGAYGYAMASNYNKVPRPAVVFVKDSETKLVIKRETIKDLMALEVDF